MALLTQLEPGDTFPPASMALREPNGLLAVGGVLDTETLLAAYERGIFPWYEAPQPVLWWSPDPRSFLLPGELHVSRSLRRTLRRSDFLIAADTDFAGVMTACAEPRNGQRGTWIDSAMARAYTALHHQGYAHSIEVRTPTGGLVGGLYGVALGGVFFGESMFSRETDASKVALVALVHSFCERGGELIDCQVENPHLNSLGARNIPRVDFEQRLAQTIHKPVASGPWILPNHCRALL